MRAWLYLCLSQVLTTSSPLQDRLGKRARGEGGAEHSARLELCLCGKLKCKSSEGQREDLLLLVVDPWPGGSEGLVDLLDCRRNIRAVEVELAILQSDETEVVHLDDLQPLTDGVKDELQPVLTELDTEIVGQGVLVAV